MTGTRNLLPGIWPQGQTLKHDAIWPSLSKRVAGATDTASLSLCVVHHCDTGDGDNNACRRNSNRKHFNPQRIDVVAEPVA